MKKKDSTQWETFPYPNCGMAPVSKQEYISQFSHLLCVFFNHMQCFADLILFYSHFTEQPVFLLKRILNQDNIRPHGRPLKHAEGGWGADF